MSHFDPEKHSCLGSAIHSWDPRAKIVSLLVLIFAIALAGSILPALAGLCVSISLVLISRIPLAHVAGFMKWPVIFLLPLALFLPFTTEGDCLYSFQFLSVSRQGLFFSLLYLTRGVAAALLALLIVGTAPFTVTIKALQEMGLPASLTQIFLFAYRYVFLLNEEFSIMSRSLQCKGFVRRSDLKTARTLAMAFAMLLIRSYERSLAVYNAMLSRGYRGDIPIPGRNGLAASDLFKSLLVLGAAFSIMAK
ncbi:MAG: Energy-coupling factor transporter transmembrane protein EcfT [Methanosaeta sp. PtaU1.Bin112]|nr:MAG: Energy-coupling factor transporter transmembrane protein EcfT [Methanosaeta sp. PtaU1.Bin112]